LPLKELYTDTGGASDHVFACATCSGSVSSLECVILQTGGSEPSYPCKLQRHRMSVRPGDQGRHH
jgi:hypothetical protein